MDDHMRQRLGIPDQEEIRGQARKLAMELYPEKFGLEPKPRSEVTVREGVVDDPLLRDEEFAERVASEIERGLRAEPGVQPKEWWPKHETEVKPVGLAPYANQHVAYAEPTISPLTRLFTAVRAVVKTWCSGGAFISSEMAELENSFEALKLDEN